ncbi:hypothetical protein XBKB1_1420040 [Xenorhabdus bovienii str. kraussei Becker Underwood]|uniref:Uncharacterized protein n=1 Tax=Xenorhabdus bovienii str. kraussei Becker Underwood TaxID=1398204 RepID=A0A077PQD2_XENBV|nr:hypothetical protein XBKB1_1420040 [Xenorhabdus bovienii str. kraussei Becker Underwood]
MLCYVWIFYNLKIGTVIKDFKCVRWVQHLKKMACDYIKSM